MQGDWSEPPLTRLQQAIPFVPAAFLVAYTLLILSYRHLVPRIVKEKLDILTHDPVNYR